MFVSIIIPTYNDWDRLSLCLDALSKQSYPVNQFEILVVNNKPASKPAADYKIPANCRIIDESKPGSYAARNKAIGISKGDIIGFTDSDCIPDKDWITNAVNFMQANPAIGRVAGHIDLFYQSAKLMNVEMYEKVFAFNQELYVRMDSTAVTANLFTYKKSFTTAGLFNDSLMSGGDYEWSVRAQKAGIPISYLKSAIVNHPARSNFNELKSKAKRVGGGQAMFSVSKNPLKSFIKLLYDLRPPVKTIKLINSRGSDLNFFQKVTVFNLRYQLSIITAYEKFLVYSGKKPAHL